MEAGDLRKSHKHFIKEKSEPDAFSLAVPAHEVHAVVPITRADERQAVLAAGEAPQNGPHTVIVQACCFFRCAGKIVIRVLVRVYWASLDEADGFIQHPGVSGSKNVAARGQGQPEKIVRTACTHAPPRRGMPPMLNISLLELMGRAEEEVLAHKPRLGEDERHCVLQLVAETECAPGLVVSTPSPEAACQGLVEKPAVGQHVDGLVWGFDLDCAEG